MAGVAGGKATLVASLRAGTAQEFANTPAGREQLLAWLEGRKGGLVVCAPSGGYEKGLVRVLHRAQRAVSLVAPGRARAYAKAMGQAAKTDPLDARRLARRQQRVEERVREGNRLEQEKSFDVADSLLRHLEWLDREIKQRDRQYRELLASSQSLAPQAQRYCSVRGVGIQTAATWIAWLPERGWGEGKALTALAGLAPWPKDSGKQQGYRAIKGGRACAAPYIWDDDGPAAEGQRPEPLLLPPAGAGQAGQRGDGGGDAEVAAALAHHCPPGDALDAAGRSELGRQFPENPLTANTDTPA